VIDTLRCPQTCLNQTEDRVGFFRSTAGDATAASAESHDCDFLSEARVAQITGLQVEVQAFSAEPCPVFPMNVKIVTSMPVKW
jgi:hypothetical protein